MVFVLSIIISFTLVTSGLAVFLPGIALSFLDAFIWSWICVLLLFLIDLVIACIIYYLVPRSAFKPFGKFFKIRKFEKKLYLKLGIKKVKDRVPGNLGMNKEKVAEPNDTKYLHAFLVESCSAELMHALSILPSFLILLIVPSQFFFIALLASFMNVYLQILPVLIQRYNRPRLIVLYNRAVKLNERKVASSTVISEEMSTSSEESLLESAENTVLEN